MIKATPIPSDRVVLVPRDVLEQALLKARCEYELAAGDDIPAEDECWAEFEALSDAADVVTFNRHQREYIRVLQRRLERLDYLTSNWVGEPDRANRARHERAALGWALALIERLYGSEGRDD